MISIFDIARYLKIKAMMEYSEWALHCTGDFIFLFCSKDIIILAANSHPDNIFSGDSYNYYVTVSRENGS